MIPGPRTPYAEIVENLRALHPGLPVEAAFLDHTDPDLVTAVDRLADVGHREIVVVPLFLTAAYHARVDSPAAVDRVQARHPDIRLRLADVVGTDPLLLTALDDRLSEALELAPSGTAGRTGARLGRLVGRIRQRHDLLPGTALG